MLLATQNCSILAAGLWSIREYWTCAGGSKRRMNGGEDGGEEGGGGTDEGVCGTWLLEMQMPLLVISSSLWVSKLVRASSPNKHFFWKQEAWFYILTLKLYKTREKLNRNLENKKQKCSQRLFLESCFSAKSFRKCVALHCCLEPSTLSIYLRARPVGKRRALVRMTPSCCRSDRCPSASRYLLSL